MWIYRSLLAVLGGSCLVVLSAALTRTAASVAPSSAPAAETATVPPAPDPSPNAEAENCVERALDALKAERVSWLETAIWQKIQLPGYTYEADGLYRMAPGQRFRLEMHTHIGAAEGTLLMVSDGHDFWQADRSGDEPWDNVTRLNLSEVFAALNGPSGSKLRAEFLQRPHFRGMTPLLRNLRDRLIWAHREMLRAGAEELIRLVGVWSAEEVRPFVQSDQPWPTGLPRQCHLYLDARTYWLRRVEWWGPSSSGGPDRLLVQMEFRDPVFNRILPEDVCARLFAFQPGDAPVEDETSSVTAEWTAKAQQAASQGTTR